MAGLVGYSSSEEEPPTPPPAKKRRVSHKTEMPPLPAAFLDQYSSTVRTSTQDDPSLHGGRKRVTPHVQGNWPAHVYLEWHPNPTQAEIFSDVVSALQDPRTKEDKAKTTLPHNNQDKTIHSLLENDLGVSLPLHISLSRPLALKTEQKGDFLSRLQKVVSESNIHAFHAVPKDLAWHSNENSTRSFLVLRLQRSADREMACLLEECNNVANDFNQPLLYAGRDKRHRVQTAPEVGEKFHISVAWSLGGSAVKPEMGRRGSVKGDGETGPGVPYELLGRLTSLSIGFAEVKVRIGQDVHAIPLKAARRKT